MGNATTLEQGLTAFKKRAFLNAYTHLSKAEQEVPLKAGELEILAESAYLTGKVNKAIDYRNRAHHAFLKVAKICRIGLKKNQFVDRNLRKRIRH